MDRPFKNNEDMNFSDYYSAEFQLNHSKLLYQFKIRKSHDEPMFAVVQEGSSALKGIKEGDVIPMIYHSLDKSIPSRSKDTRIKYICKDSSIGFKNHYVIGLDAGCSEPAETELVVA